MPTALPAIPMSSLTLAWRPFLDPIDMHQHWYLLLGPMALLLSLAYKGVRVHDLRRLPRQVIAMTLQVMGGMVALGAGFYIFVEHLLPLIAPR
jgi:hypothetical protein